MDIKTLIQTISIPASSTVRQAMQSIDDGAIGVALLLNADGSFSGLVTDGDIRRGMLGGLGLESPVSQLERPATRTARVGMSNREISQLFSRPVRVVPVLNDDDEVVDLAFFDRRMRLPVAEPYLGEKELEYVTECVLSGWVSSAGKFVTEFERRFAEFCDTRYAVATSSGTTALHLALVTAGIGAGDEVIVPTMSFIATANAVKYTGATPIFVDSEPDTWTIDPAQIEPAITPRTKAIIPVHIYGHPADMDPIMEIARAHDLLVIEDAAEAHGALYKGRRVGGIGDIGMFSFYGNKIITTGEGGMVVTNNDVLDQEMRVLRGHGMSPNRRYWHEVLGYNYRITNIQAALGVAQMEKIDRLVQAKRHMAQRYAEGLGDIPGITLPSQAEWAYNVYWLYSILVDPDEFGMTRDELIARLGEQDIDTRPIFPCMHEQPIYATGQDLPVASYISDNGLSLPGATSLTDRDFDRVIEAMHAVREKQV
jgi:perosamine synthetase